MRRTSIHHHVLSARVAETVEFDPDELLEACRVRFGEPEYEVHCDDRRTVWVKRADGTRSIGLQPWLMRQHPLDDVLEHAEDKLATTAVER